MDFPADHVCFAQGQHEVQAGTLLTWADRILAFVEDGDFLSAIELTRSYFLGEAPGNRNGLPEKREEMREVVGVKMRELMSASAHYAFSTDNFIIIDTSVCITRHANRDQRQLFNMHVQNAVATPLPCW